MTKKPVYQYTVTDRLRSNPRLLTVNGYPYPIAIGGDFGHVAQVSEAECETCPSVVKAKASGIIAEATEAEYQLVCHAYAASNGIPGLLEITGVKENK